MIYQSLDSAGLTDSTFTGWNRESNLHFKRVYSVTDSESEAILRIIKKYHNYSFRNISFLLRGSTEPTSWSTVREM